MPANLPVAFGALLAGGLLLQKGLTATKDAFTSSGTTSSNAVTTTSQPTTGPAGAEKMLAAAQAAVGGPYSVPNHASAFGQAGSWLKQFGTDCSGFISYLMGPQGSSLWATSYATPAIPTAPNIQSGAGQYVTLWNNPAPGSQGHVFAEILGQWFESAGGVGIHQMTDAEAQSYINSGSYQPYHPTGL